MAFGMVFYRNSQVSMTTRYEREWVARRCWTCTMQIRISFTFHVPIEKGGAEFVRIVGSFFSRIK